VRVRVRFFFEGGSRGKGRGRSTGGSVEFFWSIVGSGEAI
jgi:hypothetical protein